MSEGANVDEATFTVIDISQASSLVNALVTSLKKQGFTISVWTAGAMSSDWSSIPLLFCDDRERLKHSGIMCPYEFILERQDLVPTLDTKGRIGDNPLNTLSRRLRMLSKLYSGEKFRDALRDWFAGTFRMYLMLDATTHGTSEFVDLEKAKDEKDPILMTLACTGLSTEEDKKEEAKLHCHDFVLESGCAENDFNDKFNVVWNHSAIIRTRFSISSVSPSDSPQSVGDSFLQFRPLMEELFEEYFESWKGTDNSREKKDVGRSLVKALTLNSPQERLECLCDIYCDREKKAKASADKKDERKFKKVSVEGGKPIFIGPREHKERLPVAFGDRAKFVTPSGNLNLLLIDDNVDGSPFGHLEKEEVVPAQFASNISQSDWSLLREIFNVQTMSVDKANGDIYKAAVQRFREFQNQGLTYDLILVDLCLGNNEQGNDLDGYAMIRIVKVFFPGTPIVVYSRFSDMEHIARAFFSGAKWFLVKGEEAKLPRHVLKLLKQVGWQREWRAVKNSFHAPKFLYDNDDFSRRFDCVEQWKYLTYKSLEYFPGKFITVKKMGGGISSAVTFKATKGVKLGDEFLQTPSIIKIDTSYNTMMEYERYFRMIRPYMANEAGRVEMPERVLDRNYSSIVYTFAGKQDQAHTLESMGDMLDDNVKCQTACNYETYRYALKCLFDEILPKIHRVSPELEFADIGKPSVLSSDVKDAFAWKEEQGRKSSFPNFYFCEFRPSEFWKSYMLRMQPWGRFTINNVEIVDGRKRLFLPQPIVDIPSDSEKPIVIKESDEPVQGRFLQRLIFHNVMTDPFAMPDDKEDSRRQKAGRRIIEAYSEDRKLIWLEGNICDFVARFRKRVAPGESLWSKELSAILEKTKNGELQLKDSFIENGGQSGSPIDGRVQWLNDTFFYNSKDMPTAKNAFCQAISSLASIDDLDSDFRFYTKLQDGVMAIAQETAEHAAEWDMKCPVGIVHGDLNVKNIMLESRKHPPKPEEPDIKKKVSDVWLIDFARTRRDLIAHDFNVFFTSVLGELFTEGVIGRLDKENDRQKKYWENLTSIFRVMVTFAVAPDSKSEEGVPDEIKDDRRFKLIYRILRRTHDAAITAGVSQNMYLLTTALACLYTLKIFLNNGCKVRLAAAYFAAAWICYDLLCESIGVDNEMKDFKKPYNAT